MTRSQPPSMVSISSTPGAMATRWRDGGDGLAALGIVGVEAGVGVTVTAAAVGVRTAHGDPVAGGLAVTSSSEGSR